MARPTVSDGVLPPHGLLEFASRPQIREIPVEAHLVNPELHRTDADT